MILPLRHGAAALLPLLLCAGSAPNALPGPVAAEVRRALDGDTLEVSAHIWLGQSVETKVRLAGVDAPELRGRCEAERAAAQAARAWLEARLAGAAVSLVDLRYDKYGGRVLARVLDADGRDIGAELVTRGLAVAYRGGRRDGWCGAG